MNRGLLTTFIRRNSMFLCAHCPLIASRILLHINALLSYTEIIATYNGSSTLCKHVFPHDHYCTAYNSVVLHTTNLYLSIISVHCASHTPFSLNLSAPLWCPSLSLLLHCISYKRWHSENSFHTLCPTHYIFISQLFALVG